MTLTSKAELVVVGQTCGDVPHPVDATRYRLT